jgi:hypothetical protein
VHGFHKDKYCRQGARKSSKVRARTEEVALEAQIEGKQKEAIMSDDLSKRGAPDRQRVNINEEHEVRYWTGALNVTPEQLRKAVKEVGPMADDVRKWLGK